MHPENKVSMRLPGFALALMLYFADPDASYINSDTAFANRPLASRVLSTASMTTQNQKVRRAPSSSSINNVAGYTIGSDLQAGSSRATEAGGSRDILNGLAGYKQERERATSRNTDRPAGRERPEADRPGSALSSHSRPDQRRARGDERETRLGEAGGRFYGTSEKTSTKAEAASEAERNNRRDQDRYPGWTARDRPDAERRIGRDTGKAGVTRDREEDRARGTRRPGSSAAETPVTDDGSYGAQRDTTRPPLSSRDIDERELLSEVPLEVQEAWICEDLGFVLQVRREPVLAVYHTYLDDPRLQGVEGEIIRYDPSYDRANPLHQLRGVKWTIDPSLGSCYGRTDSWMTTDRDPADASLVSVVRRILPMATYYTAINAFVDLRLVCRAVCSQLTDAWF